MKKLLEDNYILFEIDVKDRQGIIETLKATAIPAGKLKEFTKLGEELKSADINKQTSAAMNIMSILYGKDPEYYGKFSMKLMSAAINEFFTHVNKKEFASPLPENSV